METYSSNWDICKPYKPENSFSFIQSALNPSFDLFTKSNGRYWTHELRESLMSPSGPIYFWYKIFSQRYTLESDDSLTSEDTPEIEEEETLDNWLESNKRADLKNEILAPLTGLIAQWGWCINAIAADSKSFADSENWSRVTGNSYWQGLYHRFLMLHNKGKIAPWLWW